jgi:hypothetical protein
MRIYTYQPDEERINLISPCILVVDISELGNRNAVASPESVKVIHATFENIAFHGVSKVAEKSRALP